MKAVVARARECRSCKRIDFLSTDTQGFPGPGCPCGYDLFDELGLVELPLRGAFAELAAGHTAPTRAGDARDLEITHDLAGKIDQGDD